MQIVNEIGNRNFEYCLVGNIIDRHYYGDNKEIRKGNKQFRPGARLYIFPEFGGMGHERIEVIGLPRKSHNLIQIIIKTTLIKNVRVQKIYSPRLREKIGENFYYKSWKKEKNELQSIQNFADFLNNQSIEISE
jgi:hypothetical protein